MKKSFLTIITITLLLLSTLLTAFASGEQQQEGSDTNAMSNEYGKIVEIPTPVVFGISGLVTLIAAIIIFRKRKIK